MLKQTSTPILGNYWHIACPVGLLNASTALECDTNYSPPVAVFLLLTRTVLSVTCCRLHVLVA